MPDKRNNAIHNSQKRKIDFDLGSKHIVIQRRYDAAGAVNDCLIALWFLIGSVFFLSDSLMESGTWLFIVGSAQLMIKPAIKLFSLVHTRRAYKKSVCNT
jgi:hypothetical protein